MMLRRSSRCSLGATPQTGPSGAPSGAPLAKGKGEKRVLSPPTADPFIGYFPQSIWREIIRALSSLNVNDMNRAVLALGAASSEFHELCSKCYLDLPVTVDPSTVEDALPRLSLDREWKYGMSAGLTN